MAERALKAVHQHARAARNGSAALRDRFFPGADRHTCSNAGPDCNRDGVTNARAEPNCDSHRHTNRFANASPDTSSNARCDAQANAEAHASCDRKAPSSCGAPSASRDACYATAQATDSNSPAVALATH